MTNSQPTVNAIHRAYKTEKMARFHLATPDGDQRTVEAPLVECMPSQVRILRGWGYYIIGTETFDRTVGTTPLQHDDLPDGD